MKTPINLSGSNRGRLPRIKVLTLAAALVLPAATGLAQSFWSGGTSDFNNAADWSGPYISGNPNCANDSGSNNIVLIQPGDPAWTHGDTLAGQGAGASGSYLQTGSTNDTGYPNNGNWLRLGIGTGGLGFYVLSNGVVNVAGQTHLGENGFGYLEIDGGTYTTGYNGNPGICAGDGDFGVSSGIMVLNSGTVSNVNNETWFGEANSACTGYLYMNGGTFYANNWFVFGRNGATGYGTMTGGTINFTGGGQFLVGGGGIGSLTQSGGTINVQNQYLVPQSGNSTDGGTNVLSGTAVLNGHDWIAVGRNGGHGEMDISGNAAITRDNANDSGAHFDVGASGVGLLNQNGGAITNTVSDFYLGESGSGTWNFNSGTAILGNVVMCVNSSASAQLNLNGGLFQTSGIYSTNTTTAVSIMSLNGATLQANADNPAFITGLYQVYVGPGSVIDSQGYTITIPQELDDNGSGGSINKEGAGTLTLTGPNTYNGETLVSAGTLATTTASTGSGAYAVASGAELSVQVVGSLNNELNMASLTLTGPATLGVDLNNFGSPTAAPINVAGALTASGTVTINVADALPQLGQFPLIKYGSMSGTSYVLGNLPVGVVGSLVNDTANNSIDLDITSVNVPRWDGQAGGNWDIGLTTNWVNIGTGLATFYGQGNPVTFNDSAAGTTTVNLVAAVTPASVTFDNNTLPYTLVGSGSINGTTGLLMEGAGVTAIDNTNGYTGPTVIENGTLSVNNLANGGSPSAIGASSASPTNLVLSTGTLSYTGPAVAINRGYSLQNTNNTIDTESNLTLSGTVTTASASDFIKSGPAQLTYATAGINALSGGTSLGYRTVAGTNEFAGPAAGQTNVVLGHFGVGGLGGTNATVIVTNATLNITTGGLDLGRSGGATGTLIVNNGAVVNALGGNIALGDGGGVSSTGVVDQAGGSFNTTGQMFVGQNISGVGVYNLSGGTMNVSNWLAIGRQGGTGTFNLSGTGVLYDWGGGGGNLDIGTSAGIGGYAGTGILNQTGGAITNTASQTWLGEGVTGEPANGTWNMSGGTAQLGQLNIGQGGIGTNVLNISGPATINCAGYVDLSPGSGTIADLNIGSVSQPGGSLTAQGDMTVGDLSTGTVEMVTSGGGVLTVHGTLYLSRNSATADGTVNLNSGTTIITGYLNNGWGFGHDLTNNPNAFNFNGGTLEAYVGSEYFIQPYVNAVVQSGGAIINDGGYSIDVLASLVNGGGGGGLTKQGNGIMYLDGANTYTGSTLVEAGTLAGSGSIASPVTVAAGGSLGAGAHAIGTLTINNTLTFQAGSSAIMKITPSSNDQIIGLTGVTYNGTLVVTNTSGTPLTSGSAFQLFHSATAGTGNFTNVTILPVGAGTFNPATGVLTITSAGNFTINPVTESAGNLILTGTGGSPGAGYTVLTTTNLTTPIANWTTNTTGTLDGSGDFSNAIPVSVTTPAQFFRVRTP